MAVTPPSNYSSSGSESEGYRSDEGSVLAPKNVLALARRPREHDSPGGCSLRKRAKTQEAPKVYTYSMLPNLKTPAPIRELDLSKVYTILCKDVQPYLKDTVNGEFLTMLDRCWEMIDQNLDYSLEFPLFLEKSPLGTVDVMIPKKGVFCFVSQAFARGAQSEIRRSVLIHYEESKGFYLDPDYPEVPLAHASSANLVRNRRRIVFERYSETVQRHLEELGTHPQLVPRPLYVCSNVAKVMPEGQNNAKFSKRTTPGLKLGQVSIESKVYSCSSNNYTFKSMEDLKKRALAVAKGLKHLQSHQMIHRDIKADNIFIDGNNTLIGDFELLKKVSDQDHAKFDPPQLGGITVRSLADERITFGFLIKEWLKQCLNQKGKCEKQERLLQRDAVDDYSFEGKDLWLKLYDIANDTSSMAMEMIIEKLSNLELK